MIEITSYAQFLNIIHNSPNIYILVDFYAPWCKPCLRAMPFLEQLENGIKINNLKFYKINIDENCECVDNLNVKSIPQFSLYYNTLEVDCVTGFNIEQLGNMLKIHINKNNKNNIKENK